MANDIKGTIVKVETLGDYSLSIETIELYEKKYIENKHIIQLLNLF